VSARVTVIGGGLAGCEAAWQAALRGAQVTLYEMRPTVQTGAHKTSHLAELVCSNSLRALALENAVGLLKEELKRFGSIIVEAAHAAAVPAGGALAVDRELFSGWIEERIAAHPRIEVRREEVRVLDTDHVAVVACGPLASEALGAELARLCGRPHLHYYDAASPIVAADSIDHTQVFAASRYGKGGADYLNVPLTRDQYYELVSDLVNSEKHEPHGFEDDLQRGKAPFFEGCLPVEEMARRGEDTLRFGPLKPVGLSESAPGGRRPYAVVQLRRENAAGTAYNLVGFQTRLTWPAQKAAFGKLPGLGQAEWIRLGVMHRNTFVDAPRVLAPDLSLHAHPAIFLAGQVSGCEGYVEASATGFIAGINAVRRAQQREAFVPPNITALGSLIAYLQDTTSEDFQPQSVSFAYIAPLEPRVADKRARRQMIAARSLAYVEAVKAELCELVAAS